MRAQLKIIIFSLSMVSCVSVKLTEELKPVEQSKIGFLRPPIPFEQTDLDQADSAWQSPSTGNSISYISDCKANSLSLKSIRSNLFSGIQEMKILEDKLFQFNGREALRSVVSGKVEGVPVKMNVVIFTKNLCTYSLTYVALSEHYEKELPSFTSFVEGFKVYD